MSWKNTKVRPGSVAQTGDSYDLKDTSKAARMVLSSMGIKPNEVGLTEHRIGWETYTDEALWSRVSRIFNHRVVYSKHIYSIRFVKGMQVGLTEQDKDSVGRLDVWLDKSRTPLCGVWLINTSEILPKLVEKTNVRLAGVRYGGYEVYIVCRLVDVLSLMEYLDIPD